MTDAPEQVKTRWKELGVNSSTGGLGDLFLKDMVSLVPTSSEEATTPDLADLLASFNVLEHLTDMKRALRGMTLVLRPEGMMIHRVDYGLHDVWRQYENQLTFLIFPEWLWRLTGSNRGYPNRTRHSEVRQILAEFGFLPAERIVRRFSNADVVEIKQQRIDNNASFNDKDLTPLVVEFANSRAFMPTLGQQFPYQA